MTKCADIFNNSTRSLDVHICTNSVHMSLTSHDLEAEFRESLTFTEIEIFAKYFQNRTKDLNYGVDIKSV